MAADAQMHFMAMEKALSKTSPDLDANEAEGVIFTTPYLPNDSDPISKAFTTAYKARWNEDPEFHGANTYDATQLLLIAMDKANPLTPENVAAEMHKIQGYKGLQGTFNVTDKGETITGTLVGIVKGGKLTPNTP